MNNDELCVWEEWENPGAYPHEPPIYGTCDNAGIQQVGPAGEWFCAEHAKHVCPDCGLDCAEVVTECCGKLKFACQTVVDRHEGGGGNVCRATSPGQSHDDLEGGTNMADQGWTSHD